MRLALAVVCFVTIACSVVHADAPSARHRIAIEATVDLARHRVAGTVTIDFENTSSQPLTELVFHRYLEAFRDEHSVFMRESRGQLRGVSVEGDGGCELRALTIDGVDRLAFARRELVPHDFTQFAVPLERPLLPGARTRIRIDFVSRLPRLAVRAGYVGDFHVVAQWFPKLAKLEDDGTFASFPYHGLGEFYADFADYDVTLHVPRDATVEGSGNRASDVPSRAGRTVRFVAPRVHDVGYVVARGFETTTRECGATTIRTTFPRAFEWAAGEHARVTCAGLLFLEERLGDYPYETLTVIVPPEGADGGAGMEYPTAFLTAGPWYPTARAPYSDALETTLHELAHQWFQGIVATNEVAHPVLDEGLSSFVGYDLMRVVLDRGDAARFDFWRTYVTRAGMTPAGRRVDEFDDYSYGGSVYGRSAVVLESIARVYGVDRLYEALGRYTRDHAFRHPGPDELLRAFDDEFGDGFGHRIVGPALYEGERLLLSAERTRAGRLEARANGLRGVRVEVELVGDRGTTRASFRSGTTYVAPTGTRCITVDPDERWLLDPMRRDDVACVAPSSEPLGSALVAVLSFLVRAVGP